MAESTRKVLVCVDSSDIAENAFMWYVKNVFKEGDEVTVATKAEINISFSVFKSDKQIEEIVEKSKKCWEEIDKLTAYFGDKLRGNRVKGNAVAITGDVKPGEALVDKAKEIRANLIVIGTRGLSKIQSALMGSVSSYVVQHAPCPVIVVRPEKSE